MQENTICSRGGGFTDANIALLGLSGAGKTNFIKETIKDINSFSPRISVERDAAAENIKQKGFSNIALTLKAYGGIKWDFNICDYKGELIKSQECDDENASNIKAHLQSSNMWIILVDGNQFTAGSKEEVVRLVKRKTVRFLMPHISDYADVHNETAPELIFVVTKAGQFINTLPKEAVKDIIMEAFEGIFAEGYLPMILLSETEATKSAGLALLTLFYIQYSDELSDKVSQLGNRNRQIEADIRELNRLIYEIEDKKILGKLPGNKRKAEEYLNQIVSLESEKNRNTREISQCKDDMGMKHLGTAVQCLIDNNPCLTVSGFDRINYKYDKTLEKQGKTEEVGACTWIALFINLAIVVAFAVYSISTAGLTKVLISVVAIIASICFIAFAIDGKNLGTKMLSGICGIAVLAVTDSWIILLILIGYLIFALVTLGGAVKLDEMMGTESDMQAGERYKDEITRFFDAKVKEKK